jgi:hypothetical protein
MKTRYSIIDNPKFSNSERILDINIMTPKIRAELFIRLYSLFESYPEISDEGYEFYIKDNQTEKEFSAALTGFGPGYFSKDKSEEMKQLVTEFHNKLFNSFSDLKDCKIEITHDFGKTILGYENDSIIEIDYEE